MVANLTWVFLVYQMPREPSTPRIAVWRQLRRLGVAQLSDGLAAVPYDASTKEQMEWIANLVMEAGGSASIWITTPTVRKFGRSLADLLAADRAAEYEAVSTEVHDVIGADVTERRRVLRRLRARVAQDRTARLLPTPREAASPPFRRGAGGNLAARESSMKWATRSGVHVDRAASAWLIHRFIDPQAEFVFVDDPEEVSADTTPFDMMGVDLTHHGQHVTFETILRSYGLEDPVLHRLGRIVHEADLADDVYDAPESAGLDSIIRGLSLIETDHDLLQVSERLFDGLYASLHRQFSA